MKNLVRKTDFRVACDIYTCNNMATFEIGHEFTTHNNMLLCEDCMRDILEEGRNILAELYQKRVEENEKNSPDESDGDTEPNDEVTPEAAEEEKNEEISEKDEIKNESATDESVSVENESDASAAEEHPEEKDAEEKSTKTKKRPSRKSSVVKETE